MRGRSGRRRSILGGFAAKQPPNAEKMRATVTHSAPRPNGAGQYPDGREAPCDVGGMTTRAGTSREGAEKSS